MLCRSASLEGAPSQHHGTSTDHLGRIFRSKTFIIRADCDKYLAWVFSWAGACGRDSGVAAYVGTCHCVHVCVRGSKYINISQLFCQRHDMMVIAAFFFLSRFDYLHFSGNSDCHRILLVTPTKATLQALLPLRSCEACVVTVAAGKLARVGAHCGFYPRGVFRIAIYTGPYFSQ